MNTKLINDAVRLKLLKRVNMVVLTDRSCGEACWHAKEDVCRCECGGTNHGILLKDGAEQPARHSRINGKAYELISVGKFNDIYTQGSELCLQAPEYTVRDYYDPTKLATRKHRIDDASGPYIMKPASKAQCVLWSELSGYKGLSNMEFYLNKPYLLWRLIK